MVVDPISASWVTKRPIASCRDISVARMTPAVTKNSWRNPISKTRFCYASTTAWPTAMRLFSISFVRFTYCIVISESSILRLRYFTTSASILASATVQNIVKSVSHITLGSRVLVTGAMQSSDIEVNKRGSVWSCFKSSLPSSSDLWKRANKLSSFTNFQSLYPLNKSYILFDFMK